MYGLSPTDAASLQAAVDSLAAAYRAGNENAPRTRADVVVKDRAFAAAEREYRRCYSLIKWNDAVADADKVAVGVRPVNRQRSPVELADTFPLLQFIGASPNGHTLRYHDSAAPNRAGKPRGATQLQLFVAVGEAAERDPQAARLYGCFTRNKIQVWFDQRDEGKRATYFARWVS